MEILIIAQTVVYILGVCGVVYWMRKWFTALEGALKARKNTIDAQKAHIDSMTSVLNTLDAPAMAQRYKGYQDMVEAEKEATIKAAERKFEEDMRDLLQSGRKAEDALELVIPLLDAQVTEHAEAVALLAVNFRFHSFDWELLKPSIPSKLREHIEQVMSMVPTPLAPPPSGTNLRSNEALAPLDKSDK